MKLALDVLLALVGAFFFPRMTGETDILVSSGLMSWVALGALLALLRCSWKEKPSLRSVVATHGFGLLFAVMTALGFTLERQGTVDYGAWQLWTAVAVYTHLYARLLSLIACGIESAQPKLKKSVPVVDFIVGKWYIVLPALLLCWLPCYLAMYPGNFVYDATKEYNQLQNGWLQDLPMLHSVLITKLLSWSEEATGHVNTGIAIFTALQMVLLALMYTHMLCKFRKLGANGFVLLGALVYCALFPGVHILVSSTVRDVLFAGLITYSVFLLWLMCRDVKGFLGSWWKPIGPAIVVVLTVLARNNNAGKVMPWLLAAVAVLLFLVGGKKGWKGALSFGAAALCSFLVLTTVLTGICTDAKAPSRNASKTLMTQSLARAYTLEGENWEAGEKLQMIGFFNLDKMKYVAESGDTTKGRLKLTSYEREQEFTEFWLEMGKKYPAIYADAILLNTRAAWFPGAVMDGYQESKTASYPNYEKCWFYVGEAIEEPGVLESKWPELHTFYQDIGLRISYEKVPVLSLLFSTAFHFWLVLACLCVAVVTKARQLYLPLLVLVAYTLISFAVPIMLLRYFAALLLAFPFVLVVMLQPNLGKEDSL